jgi:hypothetical protein
VRGDSGEKLSYRGYTSRKVGEPLFYLKEPSFLTLLVLSFLHDPMDLHASHSFLGHFGRELV